MQEDKMKLSQAVSLVEGVRKSTKYVPFLNTLSAIITTAEEDILFIIFFQRK